MITIFIVVVDLFVVVLFFLQFFSLCLSLLGVVGKFILVSNQIKVQVVLWLSWGCDIMILFSLTKAEP